MEKSKKFKDLFVSYCKAARLNKTMLGKLIGIKDIKSLRGWEIGKYAPQEDNVYKLIEIFFRWGVMSTLEQAKELWFAALQERDGKGYSIEFDFKKINPTLDLSPQDKMRLIFKPFLSKLKINLGEEVIAKFSIRSLNERTVLIDEIAMCCRMGDTWAGEWADFPHVKDVVLKPNGEYHYEKQRSFSQPGIYFCECVALINEKWEGIPIDEDIRYPRLYFEVQSDKNK